MKIIKYRWLILVLWVIGTVFFVINQPNIAGIISQKGETTIQEDAPSRQAAKMLENMNLSKGNSLIVVFSDTNKITDSQLDSIKNGINQLNKNTNLGVTGTVDPFNTPEAKDQMISEDGTTILVQITYEPNNRSSKEIINDFTSALENITVSHYITGELAIGNDYTKTVNEGVEKSGAITIIFILVVLIIMFRSIVTPLVSLFAVAISYICSMGVIGFLINIFNFPVTNFTQMFIILVLFGIGTDYHILLLNRFKEELSHGLSVDEAITVSLKTAGKTIIYSGLTVFIGFLSLSFVQFPIYRSANAVAIGIAILLIEILTLTPVIMKLLSSKLFWPSKSSSGHKDSKFWARLTSISVKNPVISLAVVALIIAPIILFNTTRLSFDSMADLDSNLPSVKGFALISEKFGAGKAMPVTVVIHNKDSMNNNDALAAIDQLTQTLTDMEGITSVSGPTRPKGSKIDQLYSGNQLQAVTGGLNSANSGISTISDGMKQIDSYLSVPDLSQLNDLSTGSGSIADGLSAVTNGLVLIDNGLAQGVTGAAALGNGITQTKDGVNQINSGLIQISSYLTKIQYGYSTLGDGYKQISGVIDQMKQLKNGMSQHVDNLIVNYPQDPDVLALSQMVVMLSQSIDGLSNGLYTNFTSLSDNLSLVISSLDSVINSTGPQSELMIGLSKMEEGFNQFSSQLAQGEQAQQQIIASLTLLSSGSSQMHTGINTLNSNIGSITGKLGDLKTALSASKNGLDQIGQGITQGNDYLTKLSSTNTFYIPDNMLGSSDIAKMLGAYMSEDRTSAKFTINLDTEPYSDNSISLIDKIKDTAINELNGTVLANAEVGVSGATSMSNDMRNMATHDITFTQIIVLAAIFILLILVIKSFWIPVYIVVSLIAAYYTALSTTAFLADVLFHNPNGMAWNVPFFSFVMIAALGVDYSIFFMERYRENRDLSTKEAIVHAARNIGGVVISAALILSGTFATLYPSNLVVLMELAICVVLGLMLLSFVFLPVVIPALITLQEKIVNRD